jgi:hypothetical protein
MHTDHTNLILTAHSQLHVTQLHHKPVLGIRDILVRIRIRIPGSIPLINGLDPAPNPDPDPTLLPTPFFSNHRHIISSRRNLILC